MDTALHTVVIGLNAVVIAVPGDTPEVLVVRRPYAPLLSGAADEHRFQEESGETENFGLPFGPFDPALHRTLEIGLRSWVEEHTQLRVDYVEQLYTFGDRGRVLSTSGLPRVISVGYIALSRSGQTDAHSDGTWESWYRYFPWEDWRGGAPVIIRETIKPFLERWAGKAQGDALRARRADRVRLCFGFDGLEWDEEKVLDRYELLYEAGLITEAVRDRAERHTSPSVVQSPGMMPPPNLPPLEQDEEPVNTLMLGDAMQFDHRRILATAMGRLRGKLKYRPIVFELMPPDFTLLELQRTVEAIAGICVHKQNFRRLVERSGLVEGTGKFLQTGGRPAEQFRFRRAVLRERAATGIGLPRSRAENIE